MSAKIAADYFATFQFHRHRGVELANPHHLLFFGNDGAATPNSQSQQEYLKEWLGEEHWAIEDEATNDDGYTWCLVVCLPPQPDWWELEVNGDWPEHCRDEAWDMLQEAYEVGYGLHDIEEEEPEPCHQWNGEGF